MLEHALRVDGAALARLGRDVPARFELSLGEPRTVLTCRDPLRVLPGRRVVARATLDGKPVLAKIFLGANARRDRAREEQGVALLRAACVPTPESLGAHSPPGAEVVLYRYLDGAQPLSSAVLPTAAACLARLHDAGLAHVDLHRGNVLVDGATVWIVDGDAVRRRGAALGRDERIRQLATLLAQFGLEGRGLAASTLASYCAVTAAAIERDELERALSAALARRVARAIEKCMRDCSAFRVERRFDRFVACRRRHALQLAALIDDPDAAMARGAMLKNGRTATVVRLSLDALDVVIKRYNVKSALHALSRAWRPTRAERAWRSAQRLEKLGIATAEPLALIERRFGPLRGRAYLVTRAVDGERLAARDPLAHVDLLVRTLARLRAAGLVHGDTKATNFVHVGDALALLDLDSLRAPRSRRARERGQRGDVRRLAASWPGVPELESLLLGRLAALEAARFLDARGAREA